VSRLTDIIGRALHMDKMTDERFDLPLQHSSSYVYEHTVPKKFIF